MKKIVILLVLLACFSLSVMVPVVAYATAGDLDTSFFLPDGYSITPPDSPMTKMAVQPNGSYVIGVGQNDTTGNTISLSRHRPDGSLDTSFGSSGIVTYAFTGAVGTSVISIVIQEDSKILVGGLLNPNLVGGTTPMQFIVRFNADGSADNTFGIGGLITYNSGFRYTDLNSIALQPDGNLIVIGGYQDGQGHGELTIHRYLSNGLADTSFGNSGKVLYQNAQYVLTRGLKAIIKNDGKVLILGSATKKGADVIIYSLLIQFNANGTLDTSFGSDGHVEKSDAMNDMGITPDGKIVTVGYNATTYRPAQCWITQSAVTLRRFLATGTPDSSFGTDGILTYADPDSHMFGYNIAIQPDGKLIVEVSATTASSLCGEHSTIQAIARLNPDGTLDSTFKNGGVIILGSLIPGFPSAFVAIPTGIFLQANGSITAQYYGWDNIVQNNDIVGVTNKLVTLRLLGDSTSMAVPTSQQIFDFYNGIENPILSSVPADLRPIGVGRIATDGINGYNITDITVSLPRFTNNVDVYVLIYAPAYSPHILFLDQAGIWDSTTVATAPYFANQAPTDTLTNLSLVNDIQVLPGEYYAAILVTPSGQTTIGSLSAENLQITGPYYLWATHWTVSPPSGQ